MENGQYLKYRDYKKLGGALDQVSFDLLEYEARKKIDLKTQNRLKNVENNPEEIEYCMFDIIKNIEKYIKENANIQSEKVGEYTITYGNIKEIIENKTKEIEEIIINDLYGVVVNDQHIIYAGVN